MKGKHRENDSHLNEGNIQLDIDSSRIPPAGREEEEGRKYSVWNRPHGIET